MGEVEKVVECMEEFENVVKDDPKDTRGACSSKKGGKKAPIILETPLVVLGWF